jgi:Zn-dependent alcohol dehydrogenase
VKFYAAGLCHSDNHVTKGDARPRFPIVGGHEGAGIVESVGSDVIEDITWNNAFRWLGITPTR